QCAGAGAQAHGNDRRPCRLPVEAFAADEFRIRRVRVAAAWADIVMMVIAVMMVIIMCMFMVMMTMAAGVMIVMVVMLVVACRREAVRRLAHEQGAQARPCLLPQQPGAERRHQHVGSNFQEARRVGHRYRR